MGYIKKSELMEVLTVEGGFTSEELSFISDTLTECKLYDDTILKLIDINAFEEKGILKKFYNVCNNHGYFPKWLENIRRGIGHI